MFFFFFKASYGASSVSIVKLLDPRGTKHRPSIGLRCGGLKTESISVGTPHHDLRTGKFINTYISKSSSLVIVVNIFGESKEAEPSILKNKMFINWLLIILTIEKRGAAFTVVLVVPTAAPHRRAAGKATHVLVPSHQSAH